VIIWQFSKVSPIWISYIQIRFLFHSETVTLINIRSQLNCQLSYPNNPTIKQKLELSAHLTFKNYLYFTGFGHFFVVAILIEYKQKLNWATIFWSHNLKRMMNGPSCYFNIFYFMIRRNVHNCIKQRIIVEPGHGEQPHST
jgi:hypothetical protein